MAIYATQQISSLANTAAQTSAAPWIPLNHMAQPFNVGFGVRTGGTITYWVEHTFGNVYDTSVSAVSFRHTDVSAQSSAKDGNYAFPVRAVRLVVGTVAVSGTAVLELIQSGV